MGQFDLLKNYASIAVIGMCKNAGKTTALNGIINDFKDSKALALTSIGRDGESKDLVTQTPKPRIYIYSGALIATASELLPLCDITREILYTTGINTPLGEVVIVRALSDGFVQLAGPSTVESLLRVSALMRDFGAETVLIDGAISRKSLIDPRLSEAVVLCTGASYAPDMKKTLSDTAFTAKLLLLPKTTCPAAAEFLNKNINEKYAYKDDTESRFYTVNSDELKKHKDTSAIFINGAVTDAILKPILENGFRNTEIIAENASKLLLSPDMYEKLTARSINITVLRAAKLAALTVNPFSAYGFDYDGHEFMYRMAEALQGTGLSIINILHDEMIQC